MNDGFCDVCGKFDEHRNIKIWRGIAFCRDCADKFEETYKYIVEEVARKAPGTKFELTGFISKKLDGESKKE